MRILAGLAFTWRSKKPVDERVDEDNEQRNALTAFSCALVNSARPPAADRPNNASSAPILSAKVLGNPDRRTRPRRFQLRPDDGPSPSIGSFHSLDRNELEISGLRRRCERRGWPARGFVRDRAGSTRRHRTLSLCDAGIRSSDTLLLPLAHPRR